MAAELIEMVLEQYRKERKQVPQRVVVHKSSRYEPEERVGFEAALRGKVARYDLLALNPSSEVRLVRTGKRPPLRGTTFYVGDIAYCYTSGYLPFLGRYPHGHVPSPLQVADHVGDTPIAHLLREIMVLTKMNWNSANMAGLWPITLRFLLLVGVILRVVVARDTPNRKFSY